MYLRILGIIFSLQIFKEGFCGDVGNRVVGASCECDKYGITVNFQTEKPFFGRIYARGFPDDPKCGKTFSDQLDTKITLHVPSGQCNVKSTPAESSVVMLISFHGIFLTTMDRQYRCMCKNEKKGSAGVGGNVLQTNHLEVSMLPTVELLDTMPLPSCDYSIHAESATGPPVGYAKVGDKIWHTWSCTDAGVGVIVRNCLATNAEGRQVELLDEHGCAIDHTILPDLKYSQDLTQASVETWAFRFSDSSLLNFMCMIETCKKASGECAGLTPPVCGRGKRSVKSTDNNSFNYDPEDDDNVYRLWNTMSILSLDNDDTAQELDSLDRLRNKFKFGRYDRDSECLNWQPFLCMILISFLFFIVTVCSVIKIVKMKTVLKL